MRRKGIIQESFVTAGTKIGFQAALPALLFQQVAQADLTTVFNPWLIVFAICAILATVLLLCLLIPLFVKGNPQRGAMIQGIYRGNFAILGVPLAINMFGEAGAAPTSLLLPFTIPLYNLLAVIILTLFEPREGPRNRVDGKKILKGIVTNPLIIGILLGLLGLPGSALTVRRGSCFAAFIFRRCALSALGGLRRSAVLLRHGRRDQQRADQRRRQHKGQDSLPHHNTPPLYVFTAF